MMTGGSVFGLRDILVLARGTLRITFFGCYLHLLIMRKADIPTRSVYILLLGPAVSAVSEM